MPAPWWSRPWPAQTNQLVAWVERGLGLQGAEATAAQGSAKYDGREYDAVVSSGEQVTSGLLALVLQSIGRQGALLAGLADPARLPTPRIAPPASPGSPSRH